MNGPSNASQHQDLDARYVAARRVLLDALTEDVPVAVELGGGFQGNYLM